MITNGSVTTPTAPPVSAVVPLSTADWLADQPAATKGVLQAIAELFTGVAKSRVAEPERAEEFTARILGLPGLQSVIVEERDLGAVTSLSVGLALGEWLEAHRHELGPFRYGDQPAFGETTVGDDVLAHPLLLRVGFAAGTVAAVPLVFALNARLRDRPSIAAYARPGERDAARAALTQLFDRARQLNPLRGRVLRARGGAGLGLEIIDAPTATRDTVILPDSVWTEIDMGIRSVKDVGGVLIATGLGRRRGIMLAGEPGVGKTLVCGVVVSELVAEGFTAVYVDSRGAAHVLTELVEEVQKELLPAVIVLEDVDLAVRARGGIDGGGALGELLRAMDIHPDAPILTLASTNSVEVLDSASVRAGRFDSIVDVPHPDCQAAARILDGLLRDVPGGDSVDTAAVAAACPPRASGADLREVVRRLVLSGDGGVSTAALVAELRSGRYRPTAPSGTAYL